jgi:hypothetical protein
VDSALKQRFTRISQAFHKDFTSIPQGFPSSGSRAGKGVEKIAHCLYDVGLDQITSGASNYGT